MKFFLITFIVFFSQFKNSFSKDELLNIVITPSRFEEKIEKSNSFIKVITAEDIKKSTANNLPELLNTEANIGVASTGGPGSVSSYFIRGFAKKYLKVTVDGMNIADPTGTQTETYLQDISIGDIEKVEILKSPQGSMHGGEAAGGVIAITTFGGSYNETLISNKVEIGSYNTGLYSGSYSLGKKDYKLGVNLNIYHTDGFSAADEDQGNFENDAYNYGNVTIKSEKKFDDKKIQFVFRDSSSKYEYDKYDQTDNHDFTKTNIKSGLVKFNYVTGRDVSHSIGYNPTRVSRITSGSYDSDQSSFQHKLEYLVQKKIDEDSFLGFGIEHKNLKYKSGTSKAKRESNSVFFDSNFYLNNSSVLNFSLRNDKDQLYNEHNSYRVQYGYNFDANTKLKISKNTGYRPPSLYERDNLASGVSNLNPEKTSNSEIGVEFKSINKNLVLSGSFFRGTIKDKIDYSGGGYKQVSGKTLIKGYELSGESMLLSKLKNISSYTYTDSETESGLRSKLVPMHKFVNKLNYPFNDQINSNISLIYQEKAFDTNRVELPAFTLLNSSTQWKLNDNLYYNLKLINILNQKYQVNRNYGTSDLAVYFGVESKN